VMYAVIVANIVGFAVGPALQGMISKNVDERSQGITMGSLNSVSSIMLVIAPLIGAPLLATVSHLPPHDWRVGAPFYASALLQVASLVFAIVHFRRKPVDASSARVADPHPSVS